MIENIFNIGSAPKYRGAYNNQNTYYEQNIVTMCSCVFICTANEQQGLPPIVVANEETGEVGFSNMSVWTCIIDNLELFNKTKRAIYLLDKAETLTKEMEDAIALSLELSSHPLYVSEDYYIMQWDHERQEYINTGIYVRGRDLAWGEMTDEEKGDLCKRIFIDRILEPDIEEIIGKVGEPDDDDDCCCFPMFERDILEACGEVYVQFTPLRDVNGKLLKDRDGIICYAKQVTETIPDEQTDKAEEIDDSITKNDNNE